MTTEVVTTTEENEAPPPVIVKPAKVKAKDPEPEAPKEARPAPTPKPEPMGISPEMREHSRSIDKSIRNVIESLNGSLFKIRLTRKEPDEVPDATGKMIPCAGFLKEYDTEIDEDFIQRKFGGGKYELEFKKPGPKGGYIYAAHTTVTIAGEPNIAELPRAVRQATTPTVPAGDGLNASIIKETMGMMSKQLENAEARAERAGHQTSGPNDAVIQILRDQLAAKDREMDAIRKEMRELATRLTQPPPQNVEDKAKDRLLDKLIDGDSARINSIRTQLESEVRQAKENAREDEKRLVDRHQRDLDNIQRSHEREISNLKTSHEVTLATIKGSAELQVVTAKASFDTQMALAKDEISKLRTENSELRTEVKELRAKKDKSPIEMLKDVKLLKEALGEDDDEDETSVAGKIFEAASNPATWEGIGSLIGRARGQAEQQAAAPAETPRKRRVIKLPSGQKAILEADGRTVVNIVEKTPQSAPGEVQLPQIDQAIMQQIIRFLESAFEAQQEPAVVAQGARSRVPEELIAAIRDHGVDLVMSKMAQLQSTSPLSTQRGRVWVRDLGKALVGE
jgi:uncharacterized coiled-coil protein SlyX